MLPRTAIYISFVIVCTCLFATPGGAQTRSVPIYKVTVIGRTVSAVNYQYRSGPTQIDFRGTVLLPSAKGEATVESKAGRTEIDAHFEHLAPAQQFGAEYLTYVLWAITPEGHAKNLGEVLANGSDKGHTRVTSDLQAFGLIVTAEPYAAVHSPSDVVVLENQVRPDTIGTTEPIQAHYELMPRGAYTYNVPAGLGATGRKVSMTEYEETVELYQAQNAVQIAEAQGAAQYAPDVFKKARAQYETARQLHSDRAGKTAIITAARQAAQTAEDARTLTVARKHDAELAAARGEAERQQQLRLQAEADAQRAQSQAADAQAQAVAAENARIQAEARANAAAAAPPAMVVEREVVVQTQPDDSGHKAQMTLRARLMAQLNGPLEALDTARGLIVTVPDSDFRGTALTASTTSSLAHVAATVMSQRGLTIEVDGNSDSAEPSAERIALERAAAVKDALILAGLQPDRITTRGLGNTQPFGPNASDNRRVEVVIHGDPIGNAPSWDKPYSLNLSR